MNIIKRLALKILRSEVDKMQMQITKAQESALVPLQTARELQEVRNENDALRQESFMLARLARAHENRIKEMAPEKQFTVKAVGGKELELETVYSSAGFTVLTVKLPAGNPWKQATELAQQLELANIELDKAREVLELSPIARRQFLGLDPMPEPTIGQLPIDLTHD